MKRYLKYEVKYLIFIFLIAVSCGSPFRKLMHGGEVGQNEFIASVPFDFDTGLPLIKVMIQGNEYTFLFDTGAPNVISQELANNISYSKGVSVDINDSQGVKRKQRSVKIDTITIGNIDFINTGALIIDYGSVFEMQCIGFDGIIGANLMSKLTWELDYESRMLSFSDIDTSFDIPNDCEIIPFVPKTNQLTPVVKIKTNNVTFNKVTFDTGAMGSISLKKANVEEIINKLNGFNIHGNLSAGIYGEGAHSVDRYGIVDSLRIGSIVLNDQVVFFQSSGTMTLGNKFLKHYRVIMDWKKNKIYLIKDDGYDRKAFESFGFYPKKVEDKLMVKGIIKESSAALQGVELGMQILEINGTNYHSLSDTLACEFITSNRYEKLDSLNVTFLIDEKEVNLLIPKENIVEKIR